MLSNKWPKVFAPLTEEQQNIRNDFMRFWHEELGSKRRYHSIEKFNHEYVIKNAPKNFLRTLEIGAGLGEHLTYEKLSDKQRNNYVMVELRENMVEEIRKKHPDVQTIVGDCQSILPYPSDYFDRILAIHVLEHLPNLPAAIKEMYRLCDKVRGFFSIVIPCEGGLAYGMARRISAKRIFEKRYKQPYQWFIEREHINLSNEILAELKPYFYVIHQRFYPLQIPLVHCNLCIGLTLKPREKPHART